MHRVCSGALFDAIQDSLGRHTPESPSCFRASTRCASSLRPVARSHHTLKRHSKVAVLSDLISEQTPARHRPRRLWSHAPALFVGFAIELFHTERRITLPVIPTNLQYTFINGHREDAGRIESRARRRRAGDFGSRTHRQRARETSRTATEVDDGRKASWKAAGK